MSEETVHTAWDEYFTAKRRQVKESDGLRFNCGRQTRLVVRSKPLVSICRGSFRKGAETGQETRFAFLLFFVCGFRLKNVSLYCMFFHCRDKDFAIYNMSWLILAFKLFVSFSCFPVGAEVIISSGDTSGVNTDLRLAGWQRDMCWMQDLYLSNNSDGKLPAGRVWCGSDRQVRPLHLGSFTGGRDCRKTLGWHSHHTARREQLVEAGSASSSHDFLPQDFGSGNLKIAVANWWR